MSSLKTYAGNDSLGEQLLLTTTAAASPPGGLSPSSSPPVSRSRVWDRNVTCYWMTPVSVDESQGDRIQRYLGYLHLTPEQLRSIYMKFLEEIQKGLQLHQDAPKANWDAAKCSLKMSDTHIDTSWIPTGREQGTSYALDLAGHEPTSVRAVKFHLKGDGTLSASELSLALRDQYFDFPKGLLDRNATASMLFDSFARLIQQLLHCDGSASSGVPTDAGPHASPNAMETTPLPIGLSVAFPIEQNSINRACLLHWTKAFETGRRTRDPVEGRDLGKLLDDALRRCDVNARTVAVINDSVGMILACAYEKPESLPACCAAFSFGNGVNGCYIEPDAQSRYAYKGCIINCEIGSFDKHLPVNDVDLEVDFADNSNKGIQLFEKFVSTLYLEEHCRRLVIKVWQHKAPRLAWVPSSMPWVACARIVEDKDDELTTTREILLGLWEWGVTLKELRVVQNLFQAVVERSAALGATAIAAIASRTGRIQPNTGGLTCAVGGVLYTRCPFWRYHLHRYLAIILPQGTSDAVKLYVVQEGGTKGAAILSLLARCN